MLPRPEEPPILFHSFHASDAEPGDQMLYRGAVKRVLRTNRLAKGQWTVEFEDGTSVEPDGTVLLLVPSAHTAAEDDVSGEPYEQHSFTGMHLL